MSEVRKTHQCPKCKRYWQWSSYAQIILDNELDKHLIKNIELNLCYPCNFERRVEP